MPTHESSSCSWLHNKMHFRLRLFRRQSCLWSRREISLHTNGRVYQAVMRSILFYGCETRPIPVADEKMLVVFDVNFSQTFLSKVLLTPKFNSNPVHAVVSLGSSILLNFYFSRILLSYQMQLFCVSLQPWREAAEVWKKVTTEKIPVSGLSGHVISVCCSCLVSALSDEILCGKYRLIVLIWEYPGRCLVPQTRIEKISPNYSEIIVDPSWPHLH